MAVKAIETKLSIVGDDKTAAAFSSIVQRIRNMESVAASASRRMDSLARGMSDVGRKKAFHESIANRMSEPMVATAAAASTRAAATAAVLNERAIQTAVAAAATAAVATPVVKRIIEQASIRQTENLRMGFSGMTAGEIAETNKEAQRLAREYKPVGQTTILTMIKDARTIAGGMKEALDFMPDLLKFRVLLQSINKDASPEQIDGEMNKILRAADLTGATKNRPAFSKFIEGTGRAMNVFGSSVSPSDFFMAAQHAGAAATQWSSEFVSGVLPSMIQTMGGDAAGTGLGSLFTALVGGRMKVKSAKILNDLGLIDPKKIIRNKQGDVAGLMPGGLKGGDLALANPFLYAENYVRPALTRKGITDPKKITETIAGAYSDRKVAQTIAHFIINREQILRDIKMAKGGQDLTPTVNTLMTEDLPTATKGLTEQFNALSAALGKGITPQITNWTNRLSEWVGERAKLAENSPTENLRTWIGGGIGAATLGHLGLSTIGGYFGGGGLGLGTFLGGGGLTGGMASLTATTPLMAPVVIGAGAYVAGSASKNIYGGIPNAYAEAPSGFAERTAARLDRWLGLDTSANYTDAAARMKTGWTSQIAGGARSGLASFGFGPAGTQAPVAKLEGAANIGVRIEVAPTTDFLVKVVQQLQASGALRADTGISMAPNF